MVTDSTVEVVEAEVEVEDTAEDAAVATTVPLLTTRTRKAVEVDVEDKKYPQKMIINVIFILSTIFIPVFFP